VTVTHRVRAKPVTPALGGIEMDDAADLFGEKTRVRPAIVADWSHEPLSR
jgi:hypothetical protein